MKPNGNARKVTITPAIREHLRKGEHFSTCDGAWRPDGPRGKALVRILRARIDQQVADVLADTGTVEIIRQTVCGSTQRHAEALIESLLSGYFRKPLLAGTVRRLAERLRGEQ